MRDRLIELLGEFPIFHSTMKERWMPEAIERLASHLLAEGVIVLPCKVGQTVYVITERHPCYACMWCGDFCHKDCNIKDKRKLVVKKAKVFYLLFQETSNKIQVEVEQTKHLQMHFLHFDIKDFGKTVFLTRDEAEAALAEREGEGAE